jgi:hypothetical protein
MMRPLIGCIRQRPRPCCGARGAPERDDSWQIGLRRRERCELLEQAKTFLLCGTCCIVYDEEYWKIHTAKCWAERCPVGAERLKGECLN